MPFGEIRNVRKVFGADPRTGEGGVVALDKADLKFSQGEFVSLLGPSGCGKTTLLKIVAGLIPKTSGSVNVGGREIDGPYADYGFVFQAPSLMPWRSVKANVLFPMEILRRNDRAAHRRAEELLELTGLAAFENYRPHQLSGGMQQRVALCRALIHAPKLLLMDEPFGALDELTRLEMNDLLLNVKSETGASVLFVTHSISEAIYMSDKVVVFSSRPARVSDTFELDLPAKRTQALRYTEAFVAAERRASAVLGIISENGEGEAP